MSPVQQKTEKEESSPKKKEDVFSLLAIIEQELPLGVES